MPGSGQRRGPLAAMCAVLVLLAVAGCSTVVSGAPERARVSVSEPCEALAADRFARAYGVPQATSRSGQTRSRQGVVVHSCQYIVDNVLVADLQLTEVPVTDVEELMGGVLAGMADAGRTVLPERVSGVGDVATYLPDFRPQKPAMVGIRAFGGQSASSTMVILERDGLDPRAALTAMTAAVLNNV